MSKSPTALNGAVAIEAIVHIDGLAVKRAHRIFMALISARRIGAFRQVLRPYNVLQN